MLGQFQVQTVCKGYQQMTCQVKVLMQKEKYNGFDPKLSEPGKNNLDPGQAIMVVFPDTMYTFRDTQGGGGGGSKLITFSHI